MHFQSQPRIVREGIQVQNDVKSPLALRPIHRCEVAKKIELFIVTSKFRNFLESPALHDKNRLFAIFPSRAQAVSESGPIALYELVVERNRRNCRGLWGWRRSRFLWGTRCGRRGVCRGRGAG